MRAVQSAPHKALEFIASAQAEAARLRYEANQNLADSRRADQIMKKEAGSKHSSLDSQRSNLCVFFHLASLVTRMVVLEEDHVDSTGKCICVNAYIYEQ